MAAAQTLEVKSINTKLLYEGSSEVPLESDYFVLHSTHLTLVLGICTVRKFSLLFASTCEIVITCS